MVSIHQDWRKQRSIERYKYLRRIGYSHRNAWLCAVMWYAHDKDECATIMRERAKYWNRADRIKDQYARARVSA